MLRHPRFRVSRISDLTDEVQAELLSYLEHFASLVPFEIDDFEVIGSAARGCWRLHSDLDVNLATGDRWEESKKKIQENPDAWRAALRYLHSLYAEIGIRIEISLEAPTIKDIPQKQCYRLRTKTWHNKKEEIADRIDLDWKNGGWKKREPKNLRNPRYTFGEDPYFEEVEKWAKIYGKSFLHLGETEDTAWMKK